MLALLLTISLFAFFTALGYAGLILLNTQRNLLQNLLLAPAIGISFVTLITLLLSRLGFPVATFAHLLAGTLLLFTVAIFYKNHFILPWRSYRFFALVFLVALLIIGRPLFEFGFSWLSYTNDDMLGYCLGAFRFLHHGYFTPLDVDRLLLGKSYSLYFWFMFVPGMMRSGSELLLAWVSGVTHLMPDQVFMPVIMTLYLTLISTTAALVCQSRRWRVAALATAGVVSLSAMTTLGVLYQLIAQLGGLGLLVANVTLLLRSRLPVYPYAILRFSILTGVVVCGLVVFYPEVFPFLGLAFLAYFFILWLQKVTLSRDHYRVMGLSILITIILLNSFLIHFLATLLYQVDHGFKVSTFEAMLFPFFLVPGGLAAFWGFFPIFSEAAYSLWHEFYIVVGGVLLALSFVSALYLSWKQRNPSAVMTSVMLFVAVYLFLNDNDFGLFKLVMYIQPFLLSTLVTFVFLKKRPWQLTALILLVLAGLPGQQNYIEKSFGINKGDIFNASELKINHQLKSILATIPASSPLILGTENIVLAKLQALYAGERPSFFISRPFFLALTYMPEPIQWILNKWNPGLAAQSEKNSSTLAKNFQQLSFSLHDKDNPMKSDSFLEQPMITPENAYTIKAPAQLSIINRDRVDENEKAFKAVPLTQLSNYLIFINSSKGEFYYLPDDRSHISLYGPERDYFYPNKNMSAVGRYLLFRILRPSRPVRLCISLTSSLNGDGENKLPPVAAIGAWREKFPVLGRGSARLCSQPLTPQLIQGYPYIALDNGNDGQYIQPSRRREWADELYGEKIRLDNRRIVTFMRSISALSEEEYAHLNAPSYLAHFHDDLANPRLEYSGVYEDGWFSETSDFYLMQAKQAHYLHITGSVPHFRKTILNQRLAVFIDGKRCFEKTLDVGEFKVKIPVNVSDAPKRRKVELRFSRAGQLLSPDNRLAAAHITFIGFVE